MRLNSALFVSLPLLLILGNTQVAGKPFVAGKRLVSPAERTVRTSDRSLPLPWELMSLMLLAVGIQPLLIWRRRMRRTTLLKSSEPLL